MGYVQLWEIAKAGSGDPVGAADLYFVFGGHPGLSPILEGVDRLWEESLQWAGSVPAEKGQGPGISGPTPV
jgi:hypothetical protein